MINCPDCDKEILGRDYYDGGDPPQGPGYWYWRCSRCGWADYDDIRYDDEVENITEMEDEA